MMCLTIVCMLVITANGTSVWAVDPEFEIYSGESSVLYGYNHTLIAGITNPNNSSQSGNLTVKIGKQTSGSYLYEWILIDTVQITVDANSTYPYEFNFSTLLDGVEPGHYKAYGKFYYLDSYKVAYFEFDVLDNPGYGSGDSGEDSGSDGKKQAKIKMSVLNDPADVGFGDSTVIGVEFSAESDMDKVRLVAYTDKPDKIAVDLSGKRIVNKYCYKDTGVEIRGIDKGVKYVVGLPLFLYDNCDLKMDDGIYRIVARDCVFSDGKWVYGKNKVYSYVNVSGFDKVWCSDKLLRKIEDVSQSEWMIIAERKGVVDRIFGYLRRVFIG